MMKNYLLLISLILAFSNCSTNYRSKTEKMPESMEAIITDGSVELYLTKGDESELFAQQVNPDQFKAENDLFSIIVDPGIHFQEIEGFGFSLTGGSALHLMAMDPDERTELLDDLFDESNMGVSYLRVSIGSSDLDSEVFSYNDLEQDQTDLELEKFSIEKDKKHLIPILKEILGIYPELKIMGSPWSAPAWMKNIQHSIGGSLNPVYYASYAEYFVKYIQAYEKEGIKIDAITVQNEPLHDGNNPSMYMEAADQAIFIKKHLGPAFQKANIETKIIIYDHNADRPEYPIEILNDTSANGFIDGSAFHLYNGSINNLSRVHQAHPDKNLYFTEQWVGAKSSFKDDLLWHTRELIIGATRNWCRTVLEWNLASNPNLEPHTDGGCTECLGAITIDGNVVKRNVAFYIIAHASKFVRPGSRRIYSNDSSSLPNVAFITPADEIVVIVVNNTVDTKSFNILTPENPITTSLHPGSVGTYVWQKFKQPIEL